MKLADCTKQELMYIVRRLQEHCLDDGRYLQRIFADLQFQRDQKKDKELDRLLNVSIEKHKQYFEILLPYEGMRYSDVPEDILAAAKQALDESKAAFRKWEKLAGVARRKEDARRCAT